MLAKPLARHEGNSVAEKEGSKAVRKGWILADGGGPPIFPDVWQAKYLQIEIADVWQLKDLRAKKWKQLKRGELKRAVFSII